MRASYPDVFPISLSRKSEGDMVNDEPRDDDLSFSFAAITLQQRKQSSYIRVNVLFMNE